MIGRPPVRHVGGGTARDVTADAQEPTHGRTRLGIVVLILGVVFLLWAWGSWIYRTSAEHKTWPVPELKTDGASAVDVEDTRQPID